MACRVVQTIRYWISDQVKVCNAHGTHPGEETVGEGRRVVDFLEGGRLKGHHPTPQVHDSAAEEEEDQLSPQHVPVLFPDESLVTRRLFE